VIAALHVGDARAHFLDDTGGFVAKRHRRGPRAIAVDDRKIGMAKPRGAHLHEDLAGARRFQLDALDGERARFRVGRGRAHGVQYGGADLHRLPSPIFFRRSVSFMFSR
jgi:hypothetical protein